MSFISFKYHTKYFFVNSKQLANAMILSIGFYLDMFLRSDRIY